MVILSSDRLSILIYTTCTPSFQNLQDRHDFTRTDWSATQGCLQERFPRETVVKDEDAVDKCVKGLSSTIQDATAALAPKRRTRADPRPHYPLGFSMKYA